jgi:hypothetical protein
MDLSLEIRELEGLWALVGKGYFLERHQNNSAFDPVVVSQLELPLEVWYTTASQKLERHWADLPEKAPNFRVPIPRFGSSDYHRSRSSHLHSLGPSITWPTICFRCSFSSNVP